MVHFKRMMATVVEPRDTAGSTECAGDGEPASLAHSTGNTGIPWSYTRPAPPKPPAGGLTSTNLNTDVEAGFVVESDGLALLPLCARTAKERHYDVPGPPRPIKPETPKDAIHYGVPEAQLLTAVRWNHVEEVERLLDAGFNPNALFTMTWYEAEALMQFAPSDQGSSERWSRLSMVPTWPTHERPVWTALHAAAARGHADCARALLARGATPDGGGNTRRTALDVAGAAFYYDHVLHRDDLAEMITVLLKAGGTFHTMRGSELDELNAPLHTATLLQSAESIRLLLDAGASPLCRNSLGFTPLHLCLEHKFEELLEILLYHKRDGKASELVMAPDRGGKSVLKAAMEQSWLPGALLALATDAEAVESFDSLHPDVGHEMKTTLIHSAVQGQSMPILEKILNIAEQESLIDCVNVAKETPLCVAIKNGHIECAKALLRRGAAIENIAIDDSNALHAAAACGITDLMQYLLESVDGSKDIINNLNTFGLAPIHVAAYNNKHECVQLLIKHGSDPLLKTNDNLKATALHIAAQFDYVDVAKAIIAKDSKAIEDVNHRGFTPFHEAAYHCSDKTMMYFLHETESKLSSCTFNANDKKTSIEIIANQLPNPADFFEAVFDSFTSYENVGGQTEISVNYGFLTGRGDDMTQIEVIEELVRCGQRSILLHPLVESLLHLKWKTLLPLFYAMLTVYGIFVLALNIFVVMHFYLYDTNQLVLMRFMSSYYWALSAVIYITIGLMVILEIFFLAVKKKRYFLIMESWLKLSCIALATLVPLAVMVSRPGSFYPSSSYSTSTSMYYDYGYNGHRDTTTPRISEVPSMVDLEWTRHLGTAALLLSWLQILLLLSRFPDWGYYVLMFGQVASNIFKILVTFVFLILSFSLCFMIQYRSQDPFSNPWLAFIKTTVMMTQEFEYDDLFDEKKIDLGASTEITRFLFTLFLVFVSVVLMSFMVGVAVSNVSDLNVAGNTKRLQKQVELLVTLDYLVYGLLSKFFLIKSYYKRYHWSIHNFPSKEKLWRVKFYPGSKESMSQDASYLPPHLRREIVKKAMEKNKNTKEETRRDEFGKKMEQMHDALMEREGDGKQEKSAKDKTKLDSIMEMLGGLNNDIVSMKEQIRGLKEERGSQCRPRTRIRADS